MRPFVHCVLALAAFAWLLTLTRSPAPLYPSESTASSRDALFRSLRVPPSAPSLPPLPSGPAVALTFDACPHPGPRGYDEAIVRVLSDSGVPATFFISGEWAEEHPEAARRLAGDPLFEIGNHSFSHPHLTQASEPLIRRELSRTEHLFDSLGLRHVPLFRPPFVETDNRLEEIAASLGLRTFNCDVASGDPDPAFDSTRIVHAVLQHVQEGDVVIMHVNGRGWHTAQALPAIIGELRRKGVVFVKASALAKRSVPALSAAP